MISTTLGLRLWLGRKPLLPAALGTALWFWQRLWRVLRNTAVRWDIVEAPDFPCTLRGGLFARVPCFLNCFHMISPFAMQI